MTAGAVLAAATEAWERGLSVLPATPNGSKRPLSQPIPVDCDECVAERESKLQQSRPLTGWKHYTHARISRDHLAPLFNHAQGLCVVTGPISGNLLMLEAETAETAADLRAAARSHGCGEVMQQLDEGYRERAPRGGTHWLLSLDTDGPVPGNEKLAALEDRTVLIETRGEGGQVVVAPSHGAVHPTGKPYVLEAGGFATIPLLTLDQWATLRAAAASLDRAPKPAARPLREPSALSALSSFAGSGPSPMERFNASITWPELLERHGWTRLFDHGERTHWCRPGKTPPDTSATTIEDGPLYVFSTSTEFEPEVGYSKFHAYALLEHGGDDSAAARHLAAYWKTCSA